MVLFLLLTNYIAALVALQLLRGDLPEDTAMNYSQITLGFLGMYQVGLPSSLEKIGGMLIRQTDFLIGELDDCLVQCYGV